MLSVCNTNSYEKTRTLNYVILLTSISIIFANTLVLEYYFERLKITACLDVLRQFYYSHNLVLRSLYFEKIMLKAAK